MPNYALPGMRSRPSLPLVLLALFLTVLLFAGGASRGDVSGQIVVRAVAWSIIVILFLVGPRPKWRDVSPAGGFLMALAALIILYLIPLPPAVWQMVPGRQPLIEAGALSGQADSWRPLSIVPSSSWNALWSLVVPAAFLAVWAALQDEERACLPGMLTIFIALSAFVGLIQAAGAGYSNPLINETPWDIRGTFANRNHFAVLLAYGCLLVPIWSIGVSKRRDWRTFAAIGLLMVFVALILGTGSRAGLLVGLLALGFVAVFIRGRFRHAPRWLLPAAAAVLILLLVAVLMAGRAISVDRVFAMDVGQDMRARSLPWVVAMITQYFPFGSGPGTFEPAFRMIEPFEMLKPTYFNHAHNDFLEIAQTTGLPGLALLLAALAWMLLAAFRVWRAPLAVSHDIVLGRLGSVMLLLILIASLFDYPARSPVMMTMIVIAALWLNAGRNAGVSAGLRR